MATEKQEITTYNGKKVIFYPNSHRYKLDGETTYLTSPSAVVGVLDKSNALLIWNERLTKAFVDENTSHEEIYNKDQVLSLVHEGLDQRNQKLEEAQDVGTAVHDYAEICAYAKALGLPQPEIPEGLPEQALAGIQAFHALELQNNIEYHEAEKFIYSESYGVPYAGKLDTVLSINGVRTLADFKTSKGIYFSQKAQLAGYHLAMTEEYGGNPPYEQLAIIHFDKNEGVPTIYIFTDEEVKEYSEAFKHCLMIKNLLKKYDKYEK